MDLRAAVADAAEIGPFFTLATELAEPGWRPFAELCDSTSLRERVETARSFLGERLREPAIDERATASMQFLGMAARLVSPALAVAVGAAGTVLSVSPDALRWRAAEGGRVEYGLPFVEGVEADAAAFENYVLTN